MPRPFLMYPDKRLKTVCKPVEKITDNTQSIWNDMLEAMYAMPGVGLAAPQIGEMIRLAVVDCSTQQDSPIRMANPEIIHASSKLNDHEEASPNLPNLSAIVSRPRAVTVRYIDETGETVEKDFVKLWATSVQHQIDHLNGLVFIDRLKPVKRRMMISKHMKNLKRG